MIPPNPLSLTPELESFVNDKVEAGLYQTASEVVRDGLRLLKEREQVHEARLSELRKDIALGIEQADNGEIDRLDIAAMKSAGRKRLAKRGRHVQRKS